MRTDTLQKVRLFGAFQKVEEREDGTLFVAGVASSESVDAVGEVVKTDAIKAALPDFLKFGTGNLREMHQLIAAGTVEKAEVLPDGTTYIETIVVDPVAIKKVQTGTYKGFSIGGKVTSRDTANKAHITGLRLSEISLVDRPCNPDAVITLYKVDNIEDSAMQKATVTLTDKEAIDALAKILDGKQLTPQQLVTVAEAAIAKAAEPEPVVVVTDPAVAEAAALAASAAAAAPTVVKVLHLEGEPLKKGMYGVRAFAEILQNAAWLIQEAEWEAMAESDSSPVPQQLREWLAQGATIFSTMSAEEVAELVASVQPANKVEPAATGEAAVAKVEPVVEATAPVVPAPVIEPPAPEPVAKVEDAGELLKAELAKRDEQLTKALGAIDTLTKRLEVLEAQPMPGKALLKAIGKGQEIEATAGATTEIAPVQKADGSVDDAATLIKAAHQRGGMTIGFPSTLNN